jgi:hypothetical protein
MTEKTRSIIDYAEQDAGSEVRNALYAAIQDKVMDHIEAKKQEIAQNLIAQPDMATAQDTEVENY